MAEESTTTQGMATIVEIGSGTEYRILMDGATVDCPATAMGGATYVPGERVTVTIRNPRRPLIEGVEDTILPETNVEGPRTVPPRGAVMIWPFDEEAPPGWLKLDGSQHDSDQYPYLAQKFGGAATFTLPNWAGRMPVGIDPNDSWFPSAGVFGGEKVHTLSVNEIPPHNHPQGGHTWNWGGGAGTVHIAVDAIAGPAGGNNLYTYQNSWTYGGNTGGGAAHNNMPPYVCIHWIIKA